MLLGYLKLANVLGKSTNVCVSYVNGERYALNWTVGGKWNVSHKKSHNSALFIGIYASKECHNRWWLIAEKGEQRVEVSESRWKQRRSRKIIPYFSGISQFVSIIKFWFYILNIPLLFRIFLSMCCLFYNLVVLGL